MLEIIVYISVAALAIIGLCDLLHNVWMLLIRPKNKTQGVYLVLLNGGESDFLSLAQLYEKQRWHGSYFADRIVALTDDDTNSELISQFSEKGILFVNKNTVSKDFFA